MIHEQNEFRALIDTFRETHPLTPMIRFVNTNAVVEANNAFLELTWCIEAPLQQWIIDNKIPNPHIILTCVNGHRVMNQKVVPLTQGSTFFEFVKGGTNRIHACLCFGYNNSRQIVKKFTKVDLWDSGTEYDSGHFNGYYSDTRGQLLPLNASIEVEVSREMFAKEPNPTLKYFANLFFETDIRDECHYRQRLILLFTLKIWVILGWTVLYAAFSTVVAIFLSSFGFYKDINFKAILHPWSQGLECLTKHSLNYRANKFWPGQVATGKEQAIRMVKFLTILPFWWGVMFPGIAALRASVTEFSFMEAYFDAALVYFAALIGLGIFVGISVVGVFVFNYVVDNFNYSFVALLTEKVDSMVSDQRMKARDIKREQIGRQAATHFEQLKCPISTATYIPPKPVDPIQRITLSYERIKAKVCKPFPK